MVTHTDGTLDCVLGTMGGDSQPQVLLQLLARRYGPGEREDPGTAISAPRFVLTGSEPGQDVWDRRGEVVVSLDAHAPTAWHDGLRARGHEVNVLAPWSAGAGHAHLIEARPHGGVAGAADPRSLGGAAAGL
jgi:gamma-glutamyltranspeptidase / glutathione hydrolase